MLCILTGAHLKTRENPRLKTSLKNPGSFLFLTREDDKEEEEEENSQLLVLW